jgi:hypothetical protein
MRSTHAAQNVHSYVQMRASTASGGSGVLQCSHVGLSSSIVFLAKRHNHRALADIPNG